MSRGTLFDSTERPAALGRLQIGDVQQRRRGRVAGRRTGQDLEVVVLTAISSWLAAVRGDAAASKKQAELVLGDARHHRMAAAQATWALALMDLMAGDPDAALDRLDQVYGGPPGRDVTVRAIPDHVEAGVRAGDTERARQYLPRLVDALEAFEQIGAHGWRPRVRGELTALGDPVPDPPAAVSGVGRLTPQELQVVRGAARGLSNREIAAQLFLSPRTVGHHLYKASPKLGVNTRAELAQLDL